MEHQIRQCHIAQVDNRPTDILSHPRNSINQDFGEEYEQVQDGDDLAKQLEGLALQPAKEDTKVSEPEKVEVKGKNSKRKTKAKKGE